MYNALGNLIFLLTEHWIRYTPLSRLCVTHGAWIGQRLAELTIKWKHKLKCKNGNLWFYGELRIVTTSKFIHPPRTSVSCITSAFYQKTGNDLKKTNTFLNVYTLIISVFPPALGLKAKVRKFLEKSSVYQIKLNVSCPVDYCKKRHNFNTKISHSNSSHLSLSLTVKSTAKSHNSGPFALYSDSTDQIM